MENTTILFKKCIGFGETHPLTTSLSMGARRGRGKLAPPRQTEQIVVEKWCYFPYLYKMTKVLEDGIEH